MSMGIDKTDNHRTKCSFVQSMEFKTVQMMPPREASKGVCHERGSHVGVEAGKILSSSFLRHTFSHCKTSKPVCVIPPLAAR